MLSCEAIRAGRRFRNRRRFLACLEKGKGSGSTWFSISMLQDILEFLLDSRSWAVKLFFSVSESSDTKMTNCPLRMDTSFEEQELKLAERKCAG